MLFSTDVPRNLRSLLAMPFQFFIHCHFAIYYATYTLRYVKSLSPQAFRMMIQCMLFPLCWQLNGVYCLVPPHFACYLLFKVMKFAEMCTQFQESVVEYLGTVDNTITGMNRFQCQLWCRGRGDGNCVSKRPCCNHLSAGRSILCTNSRSTYLLQEIEWVPGYGCSWE